MRADRGKSGRPLGRALARRFVGTERGDCTRVQRVHVVVAVSADAVSGGEAVCGLYEQVIGDVGSAVVFVLDYVQGGVWQLLSEPPDHAQR